MDCEATPYTATINLIHQQLASGASETNVLPIDQFYTDAAAGTLPQFTYINPECCSFQSFHPPSAITDGEIFIKGIYEAVRNSPQWEETLFILTFDEHGGFGDHVSPPVNVPAGDDILYTEKAMDGLNYTFDFKRLGIRVPTLVISPWVGKGVIESKGTNNGGEYSKFFHFEWRCRRHRACFLFGLSFLINVDLAHTSVLAFVQELWNLDNGVPLTPRVGYSSTFEHLILDEMRTDTPATLPNPNSFN